MKATFLHASDIHLGVKIKNKNFSLREREKRRIELWETFEEIIDIAKNEDIKYLFIAGDMMNQDYCNFKDIKRLVSLFEKIRNTKVIITCGNKDPYSITSIYEFAQWPSNVYLFRNTEKVEKIEFPDGVCVYSLSCGKGNHGSKVEQIYNVKTDNSKINILLLHAETVNNTNDGLYINPEIIKYKFNYCAMGHIHDYLKLEKNIIYPGTPEPFIFEYNKNDRHGIIKGEIGLDYLSTEFLPISNRKFVYKEIKIEKDFDFNEILDLIKKTEDKIDIMKDYVKIKLTGTVSNDVSMEEIKNEAKQFFYYIEFKDEYSYEKSVVESVGKLRGNIIESYIAQFENIDKSDKITEKAFELGLKILKSEDIGTPLGNDMQITHNTADKMGYYNKPL